MNAGAVPPGFRTAHAHGVEPEFAARLAFLRRRLRPEAEVETRSAHVFLAGDRAYKLKKPIRLSYLDHRRLAARETSCREELRLNRKLAGPGVYLGLMPLTGDAADDMRLGGTGRLLDWLVVMRRLPAGRMLDVILSRGEHPSEGELDGLAGLLAAFYRDCQANPPRAGIYLTHLRRESAANLQGLLALRSHLASRDIEALAKAGIDTIERSAPAIAFREAAGLVVEGHGDLRPEHVCLIDPPVVFDRVEFALELRAIDIGDELGFLGLECRLGGAPEIGPALSARLATAGFPPLPVSLAAALGLFRCLTRARLCIDHLNDPEPRRPEHWPHRAELYLAEARRLLAVSG